MEHGIKIFMISFLLVSLVAALVFGGYSSYTYNNILKEQIDNHLKTIVSLKTSHIEQYAELKEQRAVDFSSDGFIKGKLTELYSGKDISEIDKILHPYIENKKMPLDKDVYEIYILDNKGNIVAEVGHEEEEEEHEEEYNFHEDPLYVKGRDKPYFTSILFDEGFGVKGFAVSAPILDNNRLLGVIILKIGLDSLFEITLDEQGLGETGETYLINEEKFLVTPSRFLIGKDGGVLVQKIDTENVGDCFNETIEGHFTKTESIISFLDYRGEEVLGTHREISDINWCLIIEISKSEALDTPLRNYIVRHIIVGLVVVLVLTLIGFFTGRYFEKKKGRRK